MKAISELRTDAEPLLPSVGAWCRAWRVLGLANAIVRQQTSLSEPIIRWMSGNINRWQQYQPGEAGHLVDVS